MLEIRDIQQAVRATAQKYGLTKVVLFGSFARGDAHEGSDVDFLVETSAPLGFARGAIYNELEASLNRPVDIVFGVQNLYPFIGDAVDSEGIVLYEAR